MKKLFNLLLVALLGVVFLTSCDKDELDPDAETKLTANFINPKANAIIGETVEFNVTVVSDERLKSIVVNVNGEQKQEKTSGFTSNTGDNFKFNYTTKEEDAGEEIEFEVVVTDRKDKIVSAKHVLKVADAAFTVELVDAPKYAKPGEKIDFKANVVAHKKISSIELRQGITTVNKKESGFDSEIEHVYIQEYTVAEGDKGKTLQFAVIVKNGAGEEKKVEHSVYIANDFTAYSAKIFGAQNNADLGSFFSTSNGQIYKIAEAKTSSSLIDFVYFHGATNQATIASPDEPNVFSGNGAVHTGTNGVTTWSKRNATRFKVTEITAAQFAEVEDDVDLIVNASGAELKLANQLTVGKVIAFTTDGGKSGLFLVKAITTGNTGSITVDVKVQK
jgi:hypothetical protein